MNNVSRRNALPRIVLTALGLSGAALLGSEPKEVEAATDPIARARIASLEARLKSLEDWSRFPWTPPGVPRV